MNKQHPPALSCSEPSSSSTDEGAHVALSGLFAWLKDNPLIVGLGAVLVFVAQTWFKDVFLPGFIPLNVITTISTSSPGREKPYISNNGKAYYSPLELSVSAKNPGKKKLYLLKSMWIGEVCSIIDFNYDKNDREGATSRNFLEFVKKNNQAYKSGTGQAYDGYTRVCRFIGTGPLFSEKSFVSPEETLSVRMLIVYPAETIYYTGDSARKVDFIRITTYVPSMSREVDNVRANLYFRPSDSDSDVARAPHGVEIWRQEGPELEQNPYDVQKSQQVGTDRSRGGQSVPRQKNDSCVFEEIITGDEDKSKWQSWCPLEAEESSKLKVSVNKSVTETWLKDRLESSQRT